MRITFKTFRLNLRHTFTIARGSSDYRDVLFLRLEHGGHTGWGMAAPNSRYGETAATTAAAFDRMEAHLPASPAAYSPLLTRLRSNSGGAQAAMAAFDMAVMDWLGKSLAAPLYRIWGVDPLTMPPTSMTIGIDQPEVVRQKTREAAEFHVLKVKLGSSDDRALIETIRSVSSQTIRVDANEGWPDGEMAAREIEWLAKRNVELVEQPLPADQAEAMVWLKPRSALPLIADEAFGLPGDLLNLHQGFHGVNLKLQKCGGTQAAREAIDLARLLGMQIMLGCMVESAPGIAAAAHLAPLVDYVDLDGDRLVVNDVFQPMALVDGKLVLPDGPGLGVAPLKDPLFGA